MNKAEIDIIIMSLNSIISLLTTLDPALAQNKVVADLQAAISTLQALGI
jgi:hypothetical protein